jgi:hypothetical protein
VTKSRACLAAVVFASACAAPASFSVPQFDVAVSVWPDGSIEIHETITVKFPESDGTRFERRIPLERADSLSFQSAALDGTSLTPGQTGETSLDVDDGPGLRATWTFPPAPNTTRVFEVVYHANGAVAVRGARGTIRQTVIPSERLYNVEAARVRLAVDRRLHLFDGAGIAEAGWDVSRTSDGIAAERAGLPPAEGATVMAELGIEPALIAEPAWQRHEEGGRDLIPAFVSGGLFILVIGAGVLWIVRFQYPRRPAGAAALTEADLRERTTVRTGLRTTGYVAIALSGVLAIVTRLTLSHFGWWPMSLPVSILIVGVVFLAVGRRFV